MRVHLLNSTGSRLIHVDPFSEWHASQTYLGLIICRMVTDLTPDVTFPPVLDYTSSCGDAC